MKKGESIGNYTPDTPNLSVDLLTVALPNKDLFYTYRPQIEWYAIGSIAMGIHGLGHVARVMIWQEIISRIIENKGIRIDHEALRWASAIHDTQRHDDLYDLNHGQRAAYWLKENQFRLATPKSEKTLLKTIHVINNHVNHDGKINMTPELVIFKDADGLDRVRVDDLDPDFLRLNTSRKLVDSAKLLFDLSNRQGDLFDNAIAAAIELGLVSK